MHERSARLRKHMIAGTIVLAMAATGLSGCKKAVTSQSSTSGVLKEDMQAAPTFLSAGGDGNWGPELRQEFYQQDQGSQLIRLSWLRALKAETGEPFLTGQLARFGYLPNPDNPHGLPVGFTVNGEGDQASAGLSCAACHTRQITVDGKDYRIDGGPAIADFQGMYTGIVDALTRAAASDSSFKTFADAVLGTNANDTSRQALRQEVGDWLAREQTMVKKALPHAQMWGLGRLDAVDMIFNRVAGLDIDPSANNINERNIAPADAPVRYPFIWNAARQDFTQWPGFAGNGDNLLGLARNLGEVYGVFATFRPKHDALFPFAVDFGVDYGLPHVTRRARNSANFAGLGKLENLIGKIPPPTYVWPIDNALRQRGAEIFAHNCAASCHEQKEGEPRPLIPLNRKTWATPIQDVQTDSHELEILTRTVNSGELAGAWQIPFKQVPQDESVFELLKFSVVGSLLQGGLLKAGPEVAPLSTLGPLQHNTPKLADELKAAYALQRDASHPQHGYESRVLHGIWAAGPYLHNGSVPTLADLLKPSKDRPASFKVGRNYDVHNLGLAAVQPGSTFTRTTTDCTQRNTGESRCGHEGPRFGTNLPPADKAALLEYLKSL